MLTARRRIAVVLLSIAGGLGFFAAGSESAVSLDGVSAAFQPFASSFLSPSTGFVLGGVGCRFGFNGAQRPCKPVIVTTSDAGVHWRAVSSAPTTLEPVGIFGLVDPLVKAITFADPRDGWLFGPGLWATHDGGQHWKRIAINMPVVGVVSSGGWAYAATYPRLGESRGSSSLWRSPVGRDDWQAVGALASTASSLVSVLAASGRSLWVGVLPANATDTSVPVLWRTTDGAHWQRIAQPCASASSAVLSIDATSATDLVMVCTGSSGHEEIVTSTDGGIHTRRTAQAPAGTFFEVVGAALGELKTIVLASPNDVVVPATALPPVRSELERTGDGGRSWTRTVYGKPNVGWADLQFLSPTVAWAVHGYPGASADQLVHSTDAGASFKPVRF